MLKEIDQRTLKHLFHYDPDIGVFTRKVRIAFRTKIGEIAGSANGKGYLQTKIYGKNYQIHRLAWMYMTGNWPNGEIDHIDGARTNNIFSNLRVVDRIGNMQNLRKAHKSNASSKLLGVSWHKGQQKWSARIRFNGGRKNIGAFDTAEAAHEAYLEQKRLLHSTCSI